MVWSLDFHFRTYRRCDSWLSPLILNPNAVNIHKAADRADLAKSCMRRAGPMCSLWAPNVIGFTNNGARTNTINWYYSRCRGGGGAKPTSSFAIRFLARTHVFKVSEWVNTMHPRIENASAAQTCKYFARTTFSKFAAQQKKICV